MSDAWREPDDALGARLGHAFRDPELLRTALTHASLARELDGSAGNERLEFLGDAVLDLVISRALFESQPGWTEGELSRARAELVNGASLARRAEALELGAYLRLGGSELRSGGRAKRTLLADAFEAVVGALYLDAGLDVTAAFLRRTLPEAWDPARPRPERDPKTRFQEWAHAELQQTPRYRLVEDTGEEDGEARFRVAVEVAGEAFGEGVGRTKQAAERGAAREALGRVEEGAGTSAATDARGPEPAR